MSQPTVADFYARTKPGGSRIKAFVRELPENVPTRVPDGLSRAADIKGVRSSFHGAARTLDIPVRLIIRDGDVWILRLPKDNTRRAERE